MPGLLYADDMVLSGESEDDLRVMVGCFVEVCRRGCLKVDAGGSKVMVLGGEERLECEVCVDGICLEHVSEFEYLGCVLDELGTDEEECSRKVVSGRRVASAIGSLVDAGSLQLECAMILPESLLVPVLAYGSETTIWREKEGSGIGPVQVDSLRSLLDVRRGDGVPNARMKQLCGVTKGVEEKIDEGVLRWFGM